MKAIYDITKNFHGGNEISIAANERAMPNKAVVKKMIIDFMKRQPGTRTHVKDVIAAIGVPHQTTSARLSDLKAEGIIEPVMVDGKQLRRAGCGVVRLVLMDEQFGLFR